MLMPRYPGESLVRAMARSPFWREAMPASYKVLPMCLPLLGRATRIGPVGTGQMTKLANQIIVGGTMVAVAEALHFVTRGGADPAAVRQALMGGFANSKILNLHGERMVAT